MRVVFMGTPEFAVPSLDILFKNHTVLAVVTQPDRPKGRGQKLAISPIKERALKEDVPIFQPEKVSDEGFVKELQALQPEVIVVVAFGQKISRKILDIPVYGCINVHSSLLPRYRGAAPINYAIINGDQETGVSTMYLNEEWDAGDIILQEKVAILPTDTAGDLHDRLMVKGAELLNQTLKLISEGKAPRIPQDHSLATYAPKLTKEQGKLDFNLTAEQANFLIRGMNPWPVAYTYYKVRESRFGKRLLRKVLVIQEKS